MTLSQVEHCRSNGGSLAGMPRSRWREKRTLVANRALDRDLERLTCEKAELVAALRSPLHEDFVDASVRQFCASARARFQACTDFDAKRQFAVGHVERVIYNRYKVTIAGSIPVQSASGETKLPFRIEGEIDPKTVRSRPRTMRPEDGRWKATPERDVAAPSPAQKFGLVRPL